MKKEIKIVITGGHHSSAFPVIEELIGLSKNYQFFWFGKKYSSEINKNESLEYKEIKKRGYPFYEVKTAKVYRKLNLKTPFIIANSFISSLRRLNNIKPQLILSFGGYLAVPVCLAGFFLKIPCFTHEQTVSGGYANKFIALFAKKVFISWPQSRGIFNKNKTIISGIPLSEGYSDNFSRNNSTKYDFFPNGLKTIFVTGGKEGSHILNKVIFEALPKLLLNYNVVHLTGSHSVYNDYGTALKIKDNLTHNKGVYDPREFLFEDEYFKMLNGCNLVISRSGAHTAYKLGVLKKPSVLIPLPWASRNEQLENAKVLQESGMALVLEEKELKKETLLEYLEKAFKINIQQVKSLNLPLNAAKIISQEIEKLLV